MGASLAAGMQAAQAQPAPQPEPQQVSQPEPVLRASPPPMNADPAPADLPEGLEYHLGIDGEIQGPFDAAAMVDLVQAGRVNGQTLAWTAGMEGWEPMEAVDELAASLDHMPPPMPTALPGPGAG